MATTNPNYIVPVLGEKILVQIGDGATPTEVFAHPNAINTSRGITFTANATAEELVDLANQSNPAQTVRHITSTDCKVDGAGMVSKADTLTWIQWAQSGAIKNCKITDGNWTVTGPFVLTSFQVTGERSKSSTCTITLEQAGALTVAAAS